MKSLFNQIYRLLFPKRYFKNLYEEASRDYAYNIKINDYLFENSKRLSQEELKLYQDLYNKMYQSNHTGYQDIWRIWIFR